MSPLQFSLSHQQLPAVILVGIFGLLAVKGFFYLTENPSIEKSQASNAGPGPTTPPRRKIKAKDETPLSAVSSVAIRAVNKSHLGSVVTPGGRRSARIAGKTRKEE